MSATPARIERFLDVDMPPDQVAWALACVVVIRTVLETLLEQGHVLSWRHDFYDTLVGWLHLYLSWWCVFHAMAIALALGLRLPLRRAVRLALLCVPVIVTVPLVDCAVTGGGGAVILYAFDFTAFWQSYRDVFNPWAVVRMASPGVRIEIALVTFGSFYVGWRGFRCGFWRALVLAVTLYSAVFLFGFLPAIHSRLGLRFAGANVTAVSSDQAGFFLYLLPFALVAGGLLALAWRDDRTGTRALVSMAFRSRTWTYLLLLGAGFFFTLEQAAVTRGALHLGDLAKLTCAAISIGLLVVCMHIDGDLETDGSLVRAMAPERARAVRNVLLGVSAVFALASERALVFFWLFLLAASCVHAMRPYRLRRLYPLGHLLLAAMGTACFLGGGAVVVSYGCYNVIRNKPNLLLVFFAALLLAHIDDASARWRSRRR
ncbi:MAG: hypothetical protein WCI05_06545 [Myxococcales bacterium]